jgi:hypothetical protein
VTFPTVRLDFDGGTDEAAHARQHDDRVGNTRGQRLRPLTRKTGIKEDCDDILLPRDRR